MEFKKLNIEPEESWAKRNLWSAHAKKTFIYILLGAVVGVIYFYFAEGRQAENMNSGELFQSMLVGGFFGFFITNSPCARNKC